MASLLYPPILHRREAQVPDVRRAARLCFVCVQLMRLGSDLASPINRLATPLWASAVAFVAAGMLVVML